MIYTAEKLDTGTRLDAFVAGKSELTRSAAARLIEDGDILVCGVQ